MDVASVESGYVVYNDLEWEPMKLCTWNRRDALMAYGIVTPRLKILRSAFEEGIVTNVETFFRSAGQTLTV